MTDERGLYHKFDVVRTDGTSAPGQKHHGCEYFVLDIWHDPHALPALKAYYRSVKAGDDRPAFAADLKRQIVKLEGAAALVRMDHREKR